MEPEHPSRAAIVAALTALAAIAALGNQWAGDRFDKSGGGLGDFLRLISPFRWRVSEFPASTALKLAPYVAILVTLVLIAALMVPVARNAAGFSLVAATVGVSFFSAFVGAFTEHLVSYGALFGGAGDPRGAGQVLWSFNNAAPTVALWALLVGVVGGTIAAVVAGQSMVYAPASAEPWGGQAQRGPNDTEALWIPTQGGWAPAAAPAPSPGWSGGDGEATAVDIPRVEQHPPTR